MKLFTRSIVLIYFLATCMTAHATSSLSFEGRGYWLNLEIGHIDQPVVASVTFHKPGDAQGVVLRDNFIVEVFDTRHKKMIIVYKGDDPRVKPFALIVRGERATLEIAGARINSDFSWFM